MIKEKKITTKNIVEIGLLIALSYIGSFIKVQGSIALDSMAGFFASLYIGPLAGALVAGLGHLITAINSGFPGSLPMHIWLVFAMGLTAYIFGLAYRKLGPILAIGLASLINGPGTLVVSSLIAQATGIQPSAKAFFLMLVAILSLASFVNISLASLIYELVGKRIDR